MNVVTSNQQAQRLGWIALYTRAHQENTAIANIARQGFDAYCPMIARLRRHARKTEEVRRPLFPSYVFVRLDEDRFQWRPLLSTVGVRSVVRFRENLGFMPEGFVEKLRAYEATGRLQQAVAPALEPGTNVKILDGPFENLIATVLSIPEKDRVWLLLDIMGREVRIQQETWSLAHQ